MLYPKIGTLYALEPGADPKREKWHGAVNKPLLETVAVHFVPWERLAVTEKVDGANMWVDLAAGLVGKRGGIVEKEDKHYIEVGERVFEKCRVASEALSGFEPEHLRLFGELVGPKVHSSGRLFTERTFLLFDIYDFRSQKFFRLEAVESFARAASLQTVPERDLLHPDADTAVPKPLDLKEMNWLADLKALETWESTFEFWKEYVTNLHSAFDQKQLAEGVVVRDAEDTSPVRRRIAKLRRRDFR